MPTESNADGLWEVPDGWAWARLDQVCDGPQYGWTTSAALTGTIKLVRTTDISSGECNWATIPFCAQAPDNVGHYLLGDDDILISRAGSVGKSFLIRSPERAVFASYLIRFKPKIDARYVHYFLQTLAYWNQIAEKTAGIAIPNVNGSKLREVIMPIAPLAEQQRIVARIDELFTEIADGESALARARDDLDTWRRSLLKAAVTGELTREWRERNKSTDTAAELIASAQTASKLAIEEGSGRRFKISPPRDDIHLPQIPEQWQWAQLGDMLTGIDAGLNVKADGRPPQDGETGIVKISAVTWGEFDEEESKTLPPNTIIIERDIIRPGDFLISRANTLELVGAPVIVKNCTKRLVLSDKVLRLRFSAGLERWIEICLKSPLGRHQIESYASGNQLSMRNISQENLVRIAIPIPPRSEMEHAMRLFGLSQDVGYDGAIAINNGQETSTALRQSILKAAFEGRLVAQDSDDGPAGVLLARLSKRGAHPVAFRSRARRSTARADL